jgi:lysyl-tRNA synthetase class 1
MSASPTDPVNDWVTRAADDAVRHAGEGRQVTVSSGVSPSGRVHLGNMREFITVHFVADELRRRGVPVRHLHVWDDYDRFRKVPVGVDPSYAEHIGRPLSAVPDPWDCHASWAEHFKEPLLHALHAMGIEMEEISQTERYTSGLYRDQVLLGVRHRHDIEAVLARLTLRQVGIEVVLAVEVRALVDPCADREAEGHCHAYRALVQHRQDTGQAQVDSTRLAVRWRTERGRCAGEDLALGRELHV